MGVLEELRQIDEEKRRGGNPSSPSVSATSKLEELRLIDKGAGYPSIDASGKELLEPIKRAGKKFLDANKEVFKKDVGILENAANQGSMLLNFHPAMALTNVTVATSNEISDWMFKGKPMSLSSVGERIRKNMELITYTPRTKEGNEIQEKIANGLAKFSERLAENTNVALTSVMEEGSDLQANSQAAIGVVSDFVPYILAGKMYHSLKGEGVPPKVARRVVDRVIPSTDKLPVPSKGLSAKEVKLKPFNPEQVKMDLEKVTFSKVKEEVPIKGNGEVKIIGDDARGFMREDLTPDYIVMDIDGVFSGKGDAGFLPEKVVEINKILSEKGNPDIVWSSTHRQNFLLDRLLGKGEDFKYLDEEMQTAGIKGRTGGVTPDLGGDPPTPSVARGVEVTAFRKFAKEQGKELRAVLDDRIDLDGVEDVFIHTPEGMEAEHFQKLSELLSPKVKEEGKVVYHGTAKPIKQLKVEAGGNPESLLYGPGIYMTEDPAIASTYAKGSGSLSARLGYKTFKTMEEANAFIKESKESSPGRYYVDEVMGEFEVRYPQKPDIAHEQPNVMKLKADIKNPFDVDKTYTRSELDTIPALYEEQYRYKEVLKSIEKEHPENAKEALKELEEVKLTGQEVWNKLVEITESKEAAQRELREAGFDGITHIGGKVTGGKEHKVWIAFEDSQVTSFWDSKNFEKKMDNAVKDVNIENLSSGEASIFDILKNERGSFSTEKREPSAIAQELKDRVEARKRIVEEYKKVEKEAKENKLKVEEVLRDKGLAPNEIRDFIREGRDATRPLATSVTMKRVREIEKELGFDRKQSAMFNKLVTGLRNPGEMSVAEREMVLSGLEMLYKMKHGEEYHFRVNPKVARAVAQKDANRAFVVKSLSPRGWFGVKEVGSRLVASRFDYLRSHGEGSKILAEKLSDIRTMSDLRYANFRKSAKDITRKLTEEEKVKVQEILDTTNYSDIDRLLEPKHIKEAVKFFKDSFNTIAEDMVALGVEIKKLDGTRDYFEADLDAPYWPRMYDPAKILQPGKRHDMILQRMVDKGYAKTIEQAEESLIKRLSERKKTATNGHLEYDREFDVPGYETDLFGVFDTYMKSATLRLEVIKNFKQDNEILNNLLGRIKLEDSQFVHDYALDTVQKMLDPSIKDPVAENIVRAITASQVITKMGSSGIRNLGQVANTIGTSYTKSVVRAIGKTLNTMGRNEAIDFAERAAALLHSYADEFIRFDKGEAVDITLVEKVADKMEWGADKVLTFNAHKRGELGLRVFTANVAREYAADLFKELKTSPTNSRSYRMAKVRLEKLGLDPIELLKKEELSQGDRYKAAYSMVRETQFVNDVLTLPKWARGDNPWLRLLYQFKTFGIHQGRLVARTLRTDPAMSAKLLTTMGVFGAMTAETIDMLQAKIRDDETLLQQVSRYIVSGGGFGVWADTVMESLRNANGLTRALAGPTLDQAQKDITALQKGLVDGDWEMFWNNRKKDIPLIGRRVYNTSNQ